MRFHPPHSPPRTKAQQQANSKAYDEWSVAENDRIRRQRAAFQANLGPARSTLQQMMLDRAWFLLDRGECEAADALLEFVPEAAATKLLNDFFPENDDG